MESRGNVKMKIRIRILITILLSVSISVTGCSAKSALREKDTKEEESIQDKKKAKNEVTEDTIKIICDAQVEQMELELKAVSSQEAIKNISYTYYNWVRQVFEMCYLVQEPMSQEKTKALYTTYLTTLKNVSSYKIEQMHQK